MKSGEIIGCESSAWNVEITMRSGEKLMLIPSNDEIIVRVTGMSGNTYKKLKLKAIGDIECQLSLVEEK